jgi:hypothetical protein
MAEAESGLRKFFGMDQKWDDRQEVEVKFGGEIQDVHLIHNGNNNFTLCPHMTQADYDSLNAELLALSVRKILLLLLLLFFFFVYSFFLLSL